MLRGWRCGRMRIGDAGAAAGVGRRVTTSSRRCVGASVATSRPTRSRRTAMPATRCRIRGVSSRGERRRSTPRRCSKPCRTRGAERLPSRARHTMRAAYNAHHMTASNTDFESITESGPLVRELRERISRGGAITFRDFMEAALYHPRHGYYSTSAGAASRGGDFVTSPEVHPIFGTLVAKTLLELWEGMGRPPRFEVVEQGGGSGLLTRDILRWVGERERAFASALRYTLVERSAAMRAAQERALRELELPADAVSWADELPAAIDGVVVSNELVDAFPVHRVVRAGAELREVYVKVDGERFADELGALSTAPAGSGLRAARAAGGCVSGRGGGGAGGGNSGGGGPRGGGWGGAPPGGGPK